MTRKQEISAPDPNPVPEPSPPPEIRLVPCNEPCEFIYWRAVNANDIQFTGAMRCTLMLEDPQISEPISLDPPHAVQINRPAYNGCMPGSEIHYGPANIPAEALRKIRDQYLRSPGVLREYPFCEEPCHCTMIQPIVVEDIGQGEEEITDSVTYDEVITSGQARRNMLNGAKPPHFSEVRDANGNPVTFEPYTDVLDFYGYGGHSWVTWNVVRRYNVDVHFKIKYQVNRIVGKCLEPDSVV